MNLKEMFKARANSPVTTLDQSLDVVSNGTVQNIVVADASQLPDAPNLATIGIGQGAETIKYTSKSGNTLTVERGFEGGTGEWSPGTPIGRYFAAYDHNAFKQNVEALIDHAESSAEDGEVHGIRVLNSRFEFFDGQEWREAVPTEVENHISAMVEDSEVHGIRVNDGRLEFFDGEEWTEALPTEVEDHINSQVEDSEIHGLRVNEGKLEFFNGDEWVEALPTEVEQHMDSSVENSEVHGLRVEQGILQYHNGEKWVNSSAIAVSEKNTITLESETNTFEHGLLGLNPNRDTIFVFQNSTLLSPEDYETTQTTVSKREGEWQEGTHFIVMMIGSVDADPQALTVSRLKSVYVAEGGETVVPIGIPEYNSERDVLDVIYKNLTLVEDAQYTVNGQEISFVDFEAEEGAEIAFHVWKKVKSSFDLITREELDSDLLEEIQQGGDGIKQSDTQPEDPDDGDLWLDTSDDTFQGTVFEELEDDIEILAGGDHEKKANESDFIAHTAENVTDAHGLEYEEGVWTPLLQFGGASLGMEYSTQLGFYTRIGNTVMCYFEVELSSKGTSAGIARIAGLPFNSSASGGVTNLHECINVSYPTNSLSIYGLSSAGNVLLRGSTEGSTSSNLSSGNFNDNSRIRTYFQYRI